MKIWCLFSIDNNYDQPRNNLVAWWEEKPTIKRLAIMIGVGMEKVRIKGADYRLEEVSSDTKLKESDV